MGKHSTGGKIRAPRPGADPAAVVRHWLEEWDHASEHERAWRTQAADLVKLAANDTDGHRRANIFPSNIATIEPALYSATPRPTVRPVHGDDGDAIAGAVAQVLERALEHVLQTSGFDRAMAAAVRDMVVTGRGTLRVDYDPVVAAVATPAAGAGDDQADDPDAVAPAGSPAAPAPVAVAPSADAMAVVSQRIRVAAVHWGDIRVSPARDWDGVRWAGFRFIFTRDELVARFPGLGRRVPLDWDTRAGGESRRGGADDPDDPLKRAVVYQIWDRTNRRVLHIAPSFKEAPLADADDPLKLEGFFPFPPPLYGPLKSGTTRPRPEYEAYRQEAEDLREVSERLADLTDMMRVRGGYDQSAGDELKTILEAATGTMVPMAPGAGGLAAGGGGAGLPLWLVPLADTAHAIDRLEARQRSLKESIYELTGISDIARGASQASESATAQQIKASYGNLRLTTRQRAVREHARDTLRIVAELVCEHFEPETLAEMTGVRHPRAADRQAAQQLLDCARQAGDQLPPELREQAAQAEQALSQPAWEDLLRVMRSDKLRGYSVQVETNSTVAENRAEDQEAMARTVGGLLDFLDRAMPHVQSGAMNIEVVHAIGSLVLHRADAGTAVKEAWGRIKPPPPPPEAAGDPAQADAQAQAQAQAKAHLEMQALQAKAAIDHQMAILKMEVERQRLDLEKEKAAMERERLVLEHQIAMAGLRIGTVPVPAEIPA